MTLMERTPRSFAPPAPRRTTPCLPEESLKARMISVLSRVCSIKQVCRRTRPLLRKSFLPNPPNENRPRSKEQGLHVVF
ncbi:hypothetical protein AtDm6_0837 [Acetobacter tropicalis]|uniref:Uncharacterized protein n=1 Tax=Acetobacter tropicalis TaxID=104102 RepID=A0A094ZSL7_9PROT|nr:hypothetical protein AtDm6_0837 [Acetobacter tropicalis]